MSSCSNLTKWPVVDGEGGGDNVIRRPGNIKKPPRCWLRLGWEFDYNSQHQSAGTIKSSARLDREGQVCGIIQEIWPQVSCPGPAGCRVSYFQHLLTAVDGWKDPVFPCLHFSTVTLWELEIQNYRDHLTPSPKCPFHLTLLYKLSGVPQVGKREAGFLGALGCRKHRQASGQLI